MSLHIFSKESLTNPFTSITNRQTSMVQKLKNKLLPSPLPKEKKERESLMMKDFEFLLKKIANEKI